MAMFSVRSMHCSQHVTRCLETLLGVAGQPHTRSNSLISCPKIRLIILVQVRVKMILMMRMKRRLEIKWLLTKDLKIRVRRIKLNQMLLLKM